jgi:hypothetical protein
MKTRFGVVVGVGLALLTCGLFPAHTHAQATSQLSSFALRQTDVPPGYKQTAHKTYSLHGEARTEQVSMATLRAQGWKASYESTFQMKAAGTFAEIDSTIDQFKGTNGVSWDLNHALQQIRKQMPRTTRVAVQGIGESALGLQLNQTYQKVPVSVAYVVFRRAAYLVAAGIVFAPARGTLPITVAEYYARIVDNRLRHS